MATSFYTSIDGLATFYWQPIRLASATGTFNQAHVVAATDTNGLWSITIDPLGGDPDPAWDFDIAPTSNAVAYCIRFRDFSVGTLTENIDILCGPGDGFGQAAYGGQFSAGAVNLWGGAFDLDAGVSGATVAKATALEARAMLMGMPGGGGYSMAVGTLLHTGGTSVGNRIGQSVGARDYTVPLTLELARAGVAQQTLSFRPEYCFVYLTQV